MLNRFVTFEGGEGSGKSTQVRLLAESLRRRGLAVTTTREPGGSPLAERLRAFVLDARSELSASDEALIFAAARSDHLTKLVKPALARGEVVLCDRFADSGFAYQGQSVGEGLLRDLYRESVGEDGPCLTLLLDVPVSFGLARARERMGTAVADRFEARSHAFHEGVRSGFLSAAAREPGRFRTVDATGSAAQVASAVEAAFDAHFPEFSTPEPRLFRTLNRS